MIDKDYEAFTREFARLSAALERFRSTPQEAAAKADAYFHVLKAFTLEQVIGKADRWLATETKMPRPVEWAGVVVPAATAPLRELTAREAAEYRQAEVSGYEGEPCACPSCVEAGVHDKPIRFVPDLDADDHPIHARDAGRNRVVTAGHWAHGHELARWYAAKFAFWNRCLELGLDKPLAQIVKLPRVKTPSGMHQVGRGPVNRKRAASLERVR